jgi:hypothetical protein
MYSTVLLLCFLGLLLTWKEQESIEVRYLSKGCIVLSVPIRPKARGLAQHGGPPGCLEESDPAGVILYVMGGPYRLPFSYCTGFPDRICPLPSCELIELSVNY